MAINLKNTSQLTANGVKVLVYGAAGTGKTTLVKTLPNVIVLSAEAGLLSIQDADLPYIEITSMDDLREAFSWCKGSKEATGFQSLALDSISEVAEVVLLHEMKKSKDGRSAYGEMNSIMQELIRAFRDLPGKHVFMSAKLEKSADEMGKILYNPGMPGKTLTQGLPYFFDEVLAMRLEKDEEGGTLRALLTDGDGRWLAKDRSGRLDTWEAPDLGAIIAKIGGGKS